MKKNLQPLVSFHIQAFGIDGFHYTLIFRNSLTNLVSQKFKYLYLYLTLSEQIKCKSLYILVQGFLGLFRPKESWRCWQLTRSRVLAHR